MPKKLAKKKLSSENQSASFHQRKEERTILFTRTLPAIPHGEITHLPALWHVLRCDPGNITRCSVPSRPIRKKPHSDGRTHRALSIGSSLKGVEH